MSMYMYYSLRITVAKVFNLETDDAIQAEHKSKLKNLIECIIIGKISPDTNYVLALEKKNKYGEPTHYHIHFNFESDDEKETLRKFLTRSAEKLGFKLKGKEMYCFQQHPNVDDYGRWFRYCLKEKYSPSQTVYNPEQGEPELEELILLAKDERARSVKSNCERREQLSIKKTYFDKICEELEKDKNVKSQEDIFIFITKYYVEDGKPVNPTTIKGYTYNYMLMKNLITYKQFYQINN